MTAVEVRQAGNTVEISHPRLKARFTVTPEGIEQEFFARDGAESRRVVSALRPPRPYPSGALPLYDSTLDESHRLLLTQGLREITSVRQDEGGAAVALSGWCGGHRVKQTIILAENADHFHVEVQVELADTPPLLEYALSPFTFEFDGVPEFIHSPKLKFAADDVIGDRIFQSPAIALQEGGLFAALVPDLDAINAYPVIAPDARQVATGDAFRVPFDRNQTTFPSALDLHLHTGLTPKPVLAYGLIDSIATHHMHWRHPHDGSMVRQLGSHIVGYAFYLFLSAEMPRFAGYQRITRFLWEHYGTHYLRQPRPQAMPFAEYAQVCYPASFDYRGSDVGVMEDGRRNAAHRAPPAYPELPSWLDWEIDGLPVGGYRNNAPQWYDLIGNTSFWNNVRDAVALYGWGQRLHDDDLVQKAQRAVNLALAAPQRNGLFPTIYRYQERRWQNNHWEPPMILDPERVGYLPERYFNDQSASYHTASMSKTAAHLLRYYRLCESDPRILSYVRRYADFLTDHIDDNGCLPVWFSHDFQPNPHLRFNGEAGVHVWFLAELYCLSDEARYLAAAERIARFLADAILPQQRWLDTECYFSCGSKPMDFHDEVQHLEPRGTLPMIWAGEGFAALFRATDNPAYLQLGEQALDYAAFYQAVWQPHFIVTAYAFGGWDTDNGDAAWLDARQGEFADLLVWYGKALGRQDLIERGVASARAGLVLINHPRHIVNDIYPYPNYPLGLGPENIDHEGFPQSTMRTDASWGEVAGLCGANDILRQLGGAYLDLRNGIGVGVDGVVMHSFTLNDSTLQVTLGCTLHQLPAPYNAPYSLELCVTGLPIGKVRLVVNDLPRGLIEITDSAAVYRHRIDINAAESL